MKKQYRQLGVWIQLTTVCVVFAIGLQTRIVLANPEIEVIHWWNTGGDREAIEQIIDAYRDAGGHWSDESTEDYSSTRESALSRMAKGYPPTVIQWNMGTEVTQFADLGLLNVIEDKCAYGSCAQNFSADLINLFSTQSPRRREHERQLTRKHDTDTTGCANCL